MHRLHADVSGDQSRDPGRAEGHGGEVSTSKTDFSIIGKPVALIDSAGKSTGQGKYADDLSMPGMLIGKILHSHLPHAKIKKIDASRSLAMEGVVAVIIGKDAPNTYGILPVGHDETALAVDKVRYVGDNVACVVAGKESVPHGA